jgi:hypothetical protein
LPFAEECRHILGAAVQNTRDRLEPIINGAIYELNPDFWEKICGAYLHHMGDLPEHLHQILYGKQV